MSEEMIKGSEEQSYEFSKAESEHVHIECTERINNLQTEEYEDVKRVIKSHPSVYNNLLDNGGFSQFRGRTKLLHVPESHEFTILKKGKGANADKVERLVKKKESKKAKKK